jgi:glutamate synthase (ferredoxin)
MKANGLPSKQGLYDPQYERDACGIGFVVNVKGTKSHKIVHQALTTLNNLSHRGGCGSEPNTGDGAGILIQISHDFFKNKCTEIGIDLPSKDEYGIGMIFLPPDLTQRESCEKRFVEIVEEEGLTFLGWRTVPVDASTLGDTAKSCMPYIRQAFIGKNSDVKAGLDFERKLYIYTQIGRKGNPLPGKRFFLRSKPFKPYCCIQGHAYCATGRRVLSGSFR